MRTHRFAATAEGVATAAIAAALLVSLAGCTRATSRPAELASLESHVQSDTILPVTTGRGPARLTATAGEHPASDIGVASSCVGTGTVTVTLPSGAASTTTCVTSGGSQSGTTVFQGAVLGAGPIKITTSSSTTRWNVTVWYQADSQ